jgi:ATP-dependent Clp protease ATP-binding subunit ClpB
MHKRVMQALRKQFRPEFVNRIDDLIIFHTLKREELGQIVRIQLKRIQNLLSEQKISLELTQAAQDRIVDLGYDPVYGARPLKRAIQKQLENPIATKILENAFVPGDAIIIDCIDDLLSFNKKATVEIVKSETVA